jgi:hypothetical protein
MSASDQIQVVTSELSEQSLNSLVAGFSFAAAMSWNDVARYVITRLIPGQRNTGIQFTMTAILTTLLSILVFLVVSRYAKVTKPKQPLYAIAR